ncbi:MAG: hypothetical protein M5U26_04075 [Planctomycetota bacterium]|nr:hypothetical protein [Planctomycetota bacterium]
MHAPRLFSTGLEQKLCVNGRRLEAREDDLEPWLEGRSVALLVAALHDPAAELLMPLCAAFHARGVRPVVLGLDPFPFEPAPAGERAAEAAASCLTQADAVLLLSSEAICEPAGARNLEAVWESGAQALLGGSQALLGALSGGRLAAPEAWAELRAALAGQGAVYAALGVGRGPDAAARALADAMHLRWKRHLSTGRAAPRAALLAAGREVTLPEARALHAGLGELGAPPPVLIAGDDSSLDDEARCLVLARAALSPNVIPLAGART